MSFRRARVEGVSFFLFPVGLLSVFGVFSLHNYVNFSLETPLHRYVNPNTFDHLYTTDQTDPGEYNSAGYSYEGIEGYVYESQAPGTVPLYRYWHWGLLDSFYTTDWNGLGYAGWGYNYEFVECYLLAE